MWQLNILLFLNLIQGKNQVNAKRMHGNSGPTDINVKGPTTDFGISWNRNTSKSIFYLSQVILQNKLCNSLAITGTLWTNHVGLNAFHLRCHCHQVLNVAYCHTNLLYTMWKITTKNWIVSTKKLKYKSLIFTTPANKFEFIPAYIISSG